MKDTWGGPTCIYTLREMQKSLVNDILNDPERLPVSVSF